MATLLWLRSDTMADPIATWDDIEAGIAYVEEKINAYDGDFVYTPFVPGTRTEIWVLTKTEIQGLEDRLHLIAEYLIIPHIKTTWSGLMPLNYNALNHIAFALMPQKMVDEGQDPDGTLADLIDSSGYDPDEGEIDYIDMYKGGTRSDKLDAKLEDFPADWPIQIYDKVDMSYWVGERYHIYIAIVFANEITITEMNPISHFWVTFYDDEHAPFEANYNPGSVSVFTGDRTIVLLDAVVDPGFSFIRILYSGLGEIRETVSGNKIPWFFRYSEEGPS